MALNTRVDISAAATRSEWREIEAVIESGHIDWRRTTDGTSFPNLNQFFKIGSLVYTTRDIATFEGEVHLMELSRIYPSLLFVCEETPEYSRSRDRRNFVVNGNTGYRNWDEWKKNAKEEFLRTKMEKVKSAEGTYHIIETMPGGKLAAYGENRFGECDVYDWTDIVRVSCGNWHTVGLCKDGTVKACGSNANGQCDVDDLTEKAIQISCGRYHTAILLESGKTVVKGNPEPRATMDKRPWSELTLKSTIKKTDYSIVDTWPAVVKIKSIFDAVIGISAEGKIYMDGYCPCTKTEIKKLMAL